MANEVARLVFEAETKELKKAEKALDGVADAANDATRATEKYTDANKKLSHSNNQFNKSSGKANKSNKAFAVGLGITATKLAGVGAAVGIAAYAINSMLNRVEEAGASFSILNARLVTATGSVAAAKDAFAQLNAFALETPFTLDEAVNGFAKLTNLGLNPTREAMTSYANTSAAMGASLEQMIEAVADATTMEFERLKEFGIKARQEGDNVTFTFRGVQTTVKKEAALIEEYLKNIGNVTFAGAAIEQTKTLAGSISNLQQGYSLLAIAAGEVAGANKIFADANNDLASAISDPEFQEGVALLTSQFAQMKADAMGLATAMLTGLVDALTTTEAELINQIAGMEKVLAIQKEGSAGYRGLAAGIKEAKAELEALQKTKKSVDEDGDALDKAIVKGVESSVSSVSDSSGEKDDPFGDDDFGAEMDEVVTPFEAAILKDVALRDQRMELNALELEDMAEHEQAKKDLIAEFDELKNEDLINGKVDMLGQLQKLDKTELKMQDMTGKQKAKMAIGLGGQLLSAVASQSKKGFEVFKATQLAEAIISGYKSIQNSYEKGSKVGGPPVGAAFAAVAAVQTAMNVKAIQSQQFQGGGSGSISAPSGGGSVSGVSAAAEAPVQEAANDEVITSSQVVNVTVDGAIDPSGARRIIEAINEATEDGLEINAMVGS